MALDQGQVIMSFLVDEIAEICHEVNAAYCRTLGDDSQPSWKDAPAWQQDSARNGVQFHLANPKAAASHSHDNWMKEKIRDGWKYGPVKDPDKKEHPCFVPYEDLPPEQKMKDYLFKAVVHSYKTVYKL